MNTNNSNVPSCSYMSATQGQPQIISEKPEFSQNRGISQQPMTQTSKNQQPMTQQQIPKQPMMQQPMTQQQIPQQPMMQQPMIQQPMIQQPMMMQQPMMIQQPMMQQPMVMQPMVQPVMMQPMMMQPMMGNPRCIVCAGRGYKYDGTRCPCIGGNTYEEDMEDRLAMGILFSRGMGRRGFW